mmetsp:Transcript_892/g.2703  ORF Transcript_892/g.2703 Transcript_892/m.2703 type:complete len:292 (+) Transcript_892:3642-4517(+)
MCRTHLFFLAKSSLSSTMAASSPPSSSLPSKPGPAVSLAITPATAPCSPSSLTDQEKLWVRLAALLVISLTERPLALPLRILMAAMPRVGRSSHARLPSQPLSTSEAWMRRPLDMKPGTTRMGWKGLKPRKVWWAATPPGCFSSTLATSSLAFGCIKQPACACPGFCSGRAGLSPPTTWLALPTLAKNVPGFFITAKQYTLGRPGCGWPGPLATEERAKIREEGHLREGACLRTGSQRCFLAWAPAALRSRGWSSHRFQEVRHNLEAIVPKRDVLIWERQGHSCDLRAARS